MKNHAQPPDRPALWLSVFGGSVAGLISVRVALWSALTHQPMDLQARHLGHLIGGPLGSVGIPLLVAHIARQRYFLWATLATSVRLFWTLTDRIVAGDGPGFLRDLLGNSRGDLLGNSRGDLLGNSRGDLLDLILVAGAASLIRCWVVRRREQTAAAQETVQQMAVQYAPQQEGVWLPPPMPPSA